MARLAAITLAALWLALAGCGGDSGGDEGAAGAGATSGEGATGGAATPEPGGSNGAPGDAPQLDPEANQEPVPEGAVPPDERTGSPPRYSPGKPVPKERLKPVERPVYEQSRYLCRRLGLEGMRREYRISSSDPEQVAREVARRTYQREIRDAVYSGCLAGLRS